VVGLDLRHPAPPRAGEQGRGDADRPLRRPRARRLGRALGVALPRAAQDDPHLHPPRLHPRADQDGVLREDGAIPPASARALGNEVGVEMRSEGLLP
jgi:hypothetical protein